MPHGGPYLRHLGLYGFARGVLPRLARLPWHPLEASERLEQLRWLVAGVRMAVAVVDSAAPGVDTSLPSRMRVRM